MGGGSYSFSSRASRSKELGYDTKSREEIFQSRRLDVKMNPHGVKIRESRDSKEHPNSFPIILALDVTGSMGSIPHYLVKEGFPEIMKKIIDGGMKDPQVLFMGIGDHECDRAPLQIGQFESSDELLDKWLTDLYIEGNGGGNAGESYLLAWYFAGQHTATDHFEKRKKKGVLITIGDEPTLKEIPGSALKKIMGVSQSENYSAAELLEKAQEKYEVYHLHMIEGANGRDEDVKGGWKQLMGKNVVFIQGKEDVARIIANLVTRNGFDKVSHNNKKEEEDML